MDGEIGAEIGFSKFPHLVRTLPPSTCTINVMRAGVFLGFPGWFMVDKRQRKE